MEVFEDDLSYTALRNPLDTVIKVYIDSSFNVGQDRDYGSQDAAGSGWAIKAEDETLAGYGMNSLIESYSTSSELWELRGIIAFFETIKRYRPDLLNHDQSFEVYCDNRVLVQYLCNGDETAFLKGMPIDEMTRLRQFMVTTHITFHWVKGHTGNLYNGIADRFARRAFLVLNEESLDYYNRQLFIQTVLTMKGVTLDHEVVTLPVPDEVLERRAAYKARHRSTREERDAQIELWKDSTFLQVIAKPSGTGALMRVKITDEHGGYKILNVETPHYGKTAQALAVIASVLEFYYSDKNKLDTSKPLSLYGNCVPACSAVNTIRKGKDPDPQHTIHDVYILKELARLKQAMAGKTVRYVEDTVLKQIKAA